MSPRAPWRRAELRRMLLAITLLLERIDAIEFQAAEEAYEAGLSPS